ncbi:DUF1538 domain-containing protein [Acholeplasma sp. OttesenSCG-928-E16]|nr:DUF1538 domain-containing protein [Acholeplasma sp. OttesenSCG-928-E16]
MKKQLLDKLKESIQSVVPATVVVIVLAVLLMIPSFKGDNALDNTMFLISFLVCGVLLIIGLTLFQLGSTQSMLPIAERIGKTITKKKSVLFMVIIGFLIGVLITIAEPALWVLSEQFPAVPGNQVANLFTILFVVGVGVGFFLVLALLRIVYRIPLRRLLIICYSVIFAIVIIVPLIPGMEGFKEFVPFAFDSSGVTTGPMAVPFIMSIGLGVSASRSDKDAADDSFGLVGIASIGPIVAVLILGVIVGLNPEFQLIWNFASDANLTLGDYLLQYLWQMAIAIAPFVIFFIIFQLTTFKLPKKQVIKIIIGLVYTYIGLVIFLAGANAGYLPMGKFLGSEIAKLDFNWIMIPAGMVLGAIVVAAEPSVVVLNQQVEDMTSGAISKKIMLIFMSVGMAISIGLAMLRVYTGINILFILIPGYAIAIILSFITPKKFTAIAIDSGGAVSGAMTSTFLVGFSLGAAEFLNYGDSSYIFLNAFGLVAFVAMLPLITIQILGIIFKVKQARLEVPIEEEEIIELED